MFIKLKSKKIPLLIVLAIIIVAVVLGYSRSMGANLRSQANYAVQQSAMSISNEISASIGYAKSSIQLTSQSATQNMNGEVIEDVNSILDPLIGNTPFNFIEYILKNGWNTMNDGGTPFDASDREYYKHGIKGETGIWVNFTPKKSKEVLLNFYTPLFYNGRIVGVFTGTMGGDTDIRPLLSSSFFGEEIIGILCDEQGNIISSNMELAGNKTVKSYLTDVLGVEEKAYSGFRKIKYKDNDRAFEFEEQSGMAIACISAVEESDWYVLQIVPAKTLQKIMNKSTVQSILVIGCIILLFALYFLYMNIEQKKKLKEESAEYLGIIEILGKEYSSVYIIDSNTGSLVPYRLSEGMTLQDSNALSQNAIWNEALAEYAKHFVKDKYKDEFVNKCSLENLKEQLEEEGIYFYYEYVNERDGEQHVYRVIATLLPDSNMQRIVVGFADINEEREKEIETQKALQAAYSAARAANEAKSRFLYNMSHDIRTPMNAILGFANRLEKCRLNEAEFNHCVENIKVSGDYLLNIINNVLDLARIESGNILLHDSDICDAEVFYDNLVTVFSEELNAKNLTFRKSINITHNHVYVDTTKLEQVFLNVLSNAVKYTPEGGEISLTVTEKLSERDGCCCYETVIADTGIGMSQEFIPHIFDEFSRERNTTESRVMGTGLGMGITKRMIDLMNGTISVESSPGEGTTMTINLHHKIVPEKEYEEYDSKRVIIENKGEIFKDKRILLAEDNALNAEIAMLVLKDAGFKVDHANDGDICIDMIKSREAGYYDLVLMDIQMPNVNGYRATEIIRNMSDRRKAEIPIIAMTANAFEEDQKNAMQVGMNGFVPKPLELDKLFEALAKVLCRD